MGSYAGHDNLLGKANVFIGFKAGYKNRGSVVNKGSWNTIVGFHAGENTYDGNANCYYGKYSGDKNSSGSGNSFYGSHSGQETGRLGVTNNYNCMFGNFAGRNFNSGSSNIFIGYNAQNSGVAADTWNNISNSIAVGSNTLVLASDNFILGNNSQKVGIGLSNDVIFNGPRNKLEINADPASMSYTGVGGSGLQFRQLHSGSTLSSINYTPSHGKVLTLDADGIVKFTFGGGIGFVDCSETPTYLPADMITLLNNNTIYYEGNNANSGIADNVPNSIGLGYTCGDRLRGKLSVYQNATTQDEQTAAGYFRNNDETTGGSTNFTKRGIWVVCNGLSEEGPFNIAGDFFADSSSYLNIGVQGYAGSITQDIYENSNKGGVFNGSYGGQNIGVEAMTNGGGWSNYGVWALAPLGTCTTGIGTCSDAAGLFWGDMYITGGTFWTSDGNLKENIHPIENSLDIINSLTPQSYTFRKAQYPYLRLPTGTHDGLIAQEVEAILPNLVKSFKVPSHHDSSGNIDTTGV